MSSGARCISPRDTLQHRIGPVFPEIQGLMTHQTGSSTLTSGLDRRARLSATVTHDISRRNGLITVSIELGHEGAKMVQARLARYSMGLRELLDESPRLLRFMECHSPLAAMVIETSRSETHPEAGFDGLWSSSLTDSSLRGLPDQEIVSMYERVVFAREILAVSALPMIMDGDTGGTVEQFMDTVRRTERSGISAIVIEDKVGTKQNSLLADSSVHVLADQDDFARKIQKGVEAKAHPQFMIVARLEGLIVGLPVEEVLQRAAAFVAAGADALLVHSKARDPREVLDVGRRLRETHPDIPLIAVPTTYPSVTDEELREAGFRIVIYANHMLRASVRAMAQVSTAILTGATLEAAEPFCAPVEDLLALSVGGTSR
ncbi:isocitrate lyase/phosphoenolpyruvate mutase family protein [Arthrobacter sp. NPDC090010]|uniref:isocitrate lyase/phosphoenolpyruvate mutase family protein n=1 Tax=Arthrobacter sp. NPDC090010 TaxID=3363942 RepID=UPI0037FF6F7A